MSCLPTFDFDILVSPQTHKTKPTNDRPKRTGGNTPSLVRFHRVRTCESVQENARPCGSCVVRDPDGFHRLMWPQEKDAYEVSIGQIVAS